MKRCLLCTLLMLCLSGCQVLPFARELESTMLVQVLGVDWTHGDSYPHCRQGPAGGHR